AVDEVLVAHAGTGIAVGELEPAVAERPHALQFLRDHELDAARGGRPEPKAHAALREDCRAERHGMAADQLSVPGNVDLTPFSGASYAATSDRGTRRPTRVRRGRRRARARRRRPQGG